MTTTSGTTPEQSTAPYRVVVDGRDGRRGGVVSPTREQLAALAAFASENGRTWKSALRLAWETANARVAGEVSPELQQIRNAFGPSWLTRFRPPAADATGAEVAS